MGSIRILKRWDLPGMKKDIIEDAEKGIEAAVQESVSWIKNDILLDQKYIGDTDFPDVTPITRAIKNKRGERQVLISTGHYKDSWVGESHGLEGVIRSGSEGYFARLHHRWHIDKLWKKYHTDEVLKIIEKAIKRNL